MANIKLQNNNWEASGVYDIDQQKTQRQINAEVSDLKSAKAPVIIDTASGTIASFEDGADGMPLKSLTVNIEPVQAAGTPTPETPLPISGRTSCNILRYADSVVAASQFRQGRLASGGTFSSNTTNRCATRVFIPVLPDTQYTIATNAGIQCIAVHYYEDATDESWISPRDAITGQVSTITTPPNCHYVRLMVAKNDTTEDLIQAEITLAIMTATAAIAVSLPAEAGTVYGGTMDVTSGVLTITDANIASYNGESLPGAWISDRDVYSAGATPSIGAQVVYKLADPIIYQLTPQEVTTLLGTNNIWADCGSVSVDYPADTKLYIDTQNNCKIENSYNSTLYDYGVWTYGNISKANGKTSQSRAETNTSCMARITPIADIPFTITNPDLTLTVYYYSGNDMDTYLGYLNFTSITTPANIMDGVESYPTANYIRLTINLANNAVIADHISLLKSIDARIGLHDLYIHDAARSVGVMNLCKRANNLTRITYTLKNDLPVQSNEGLTDNIIPSGTMCIGMKYSSMRAEQLFVPQAVMFETFASAILNPNSYIYSRITSNPNGRTYYGAVCSTFVAYCFGITDVIPTTIAFWSYNGFIALPDYLQNPYAVQVGHVLNKKGSHIAVVTDVIRDITGKILFIGLSEASHPYMTSRYFTPEEVQEGRFDDGYILYCYKYIDTISDDDISDYMTIDDSLYNSGLVNQNLAPRRGDKANWRPDETIEIDILNTGSYTHYKLVNLVTAQTVALSEMPETLISLTNLSAGKYSLCLTDGTNDSAPVYFNVMYTNETYTVNGNNVTVSYSSNIGTPSAVLFCNNNAQCSDIRAVRWFHVLTSTEISDGYCTISKPSVDDLEYHDEEYEAPNGVWKMRVMYKTEYGLYTSDFADVQF